MPEEAKEKLATLGVKVIKKAIKENNTTRKSNKKFIIPDLNQMNLF